jgi:hypothetical protein
MVSFPIFTVETVDPTVRCFRSVAHAEGWLEVIDVENSEYRFWDRQGQRLEFRVEPKARRWLRLAGTGDDDVVGLRAAIARYAEALGVPASAVAQSSPADAVAYLANVDSQIDEAKRKRRRWYQFWRSR